MHELTANDFEGFQPHAHGDLSLLVRGDVESIAVDPKGRFSIVAVEVSGVRLQVVNLRLPPPVGRLDFWMPSFWIEHARVRRAHRDAATAIVDRVSSSRVPVIVGGDFNAPPYDRSLDPLRASFVDAFAAAGRGWGGTGPAAYPLFRVDHVWAGPGLRPLRAFTQRVAHSDHRAVVVDYAVERTNLAGPP